LNDVLDSLNRALIRQKWMLGDRWNRIGHPFIWVDGKQQQSSTLFMDGPGAVLQALSIYYEEYPTLDDVRTDDHEKVFENLSERLREFMRRMGMGGLVEEYANYIHVTALTRAQDYSFIKRYAADLAGEPAHLDIGPGFGSHAFYSLFHLGGGYTGVEASDFYYNVQRHTYRYLGAHFTGYHDPVIEDALGASPDAVAANIAKASGTGKVSHVPSWYFGALPDRSRDLITATFMLNEVSPSGIAWLLSHANRVLREGGYFYIRDSHRVKPNRHQLRYDEVLGELGYERVHHLDVQNRVDMFGIPRIYQKTRHDALSFDDMFERYFGHFAMAALLGEYMQNVK
jgi:SAM-dependent methyltransferase